MAARRGASKPIEVDSAPAQASGQVEESAQVPAAPRFARFLASVQGVVRVDAGDVAEQPRPEVLRLVRHEWISEADFRAACRKGHRNPMLEAAREV